MLRSKTFGVLALITTVLIWGSTCAVTKSALNDIGPLALVFVRFAIAYLALLPFAVKQGYRLRQSFTKEIALFGLTGVVMFFGFQNVGLLYTSAVSGVLVQSAVPAIIALFAWALLHERLTPQRIVGVILALVGSAVVALSTESAASGSRPWLGNLLVFASVISWGIYTAQGKRLLSSASSLAITTASFGSALLMLLPAALVETYIMGWPTLTLGGMGAILYLSLAVSALTMWLWNVALATVDASVAGLYINLMPIVGVIIALLAGETIATGQIVGGVIILTGVLIGERSRTS